MVEYTHAIKCFSKFCVSTFIVSMVAFHLIMQNESHSFAINENELKLFLIHIIELLVSVKLRNFHFRNWKILFWLKPYKNEKGVNREKSWTKNAQILFCWNLHKLWFVTWLLYVSHLQKAMFFILNISPSHGISNFWSIFASAVVLNSQSSGGECKL